MGTSGLKVSKIILGCMSYGNKEWQEWVLGEEEGIKQIKYAFVFQVESYPESHLIHILNSYDAGINAFDTANVS